jgi:hypothetical protein
MPRPQAASSRGFAKMKPQLLQKQIRSKRLALPVLIWL